MNFARRRPAAILFSSSLLWNVSLGMFFILVPLYARELGMSGVAIGFFYLALARTGAAAGLWPLVAARAVSVSLFLGLAVAGRQPLRMPARPLTIVLGCGVLDMAANALYMLATRRGALSAVVTLASLYPASTVLLARVVLGDRLSGRQVVGIVSAFVAVVLIVST